MSSIGAASVFAFLGFSIACGPSDDDPPAQTYGPNCEAAPNVGALGALGEGDRQILASAAFDGDTILVAYTDARGDTEEWRAMRMRIACDGTITSPLVHETDDGLTSASQPVVAARNGRSAIAYQGRRDDVWGLHVRVFDEEGIASTSPPARIPLDGAPSPPSLVARAEGFVVATGIEGPQGRAVGAVLNESGAVVTSLDPLASTVGSGNKAFFSSATTGATTYIAWTELGMASVDDSAVLLAKVDSDGGLVPGTDVAPGAVTIRPSLATFGDNLFLAYTEGVDEGRDIVLRAVLGDGTIIDGRIGDPGIPESGAKLALESEVRGAIAHYRDNDLFVSAISIEDGTLVSASEPELVSSEAAGAFESTLVHIRDGIYFLAWSDLIPEDAVFEVRGAFVSPARTP